MKILSTCLSFDLNNDLEKTCFEVLTSLGSHAKLFVRTMIYVSFSSSVKRLYTNDGNDILANGTVLLSLIEKYKKEYVFKKGDNVIFLNWNRNDETDMACFRILSLFGGGEKGFIMHMLKQCYPFFFDADATLPKYIKISRKTNKKQENTSLSKPSMPASEQNEDKKLIKNKKTIEPEIDEPVEITVEEEIELMDIISKGFE